MSRTPPLYATGRWTLKPPFNAPANAIYVSQAVRSISDLKARNIDPYKTFYEIQGISEADYENDVRNLANIVTLMSDTHPIIYVPDTYIISYPDSANIPYRHLVMSISLGAVPDTLSLNYLRSKISEMTLELLGVNGNVRIHQAGALAEHVDQMTHMALENARKAKIENVETEYSKLLRKDDELETLRLQNRILTDILIANNLLN